MDFSLPGVATGAIDRVWFDSEGSQIFARSTSGVVYSTSDLDNWQATADAKAPQVDNVTVRRAPAGTRIVRAQFPNSARSYAGGSHLLRSENGENWQNLTAFKGQSILGGDILDIAVSPKDEDELVVGAATGIWRSIDGGKTWLSLNNSLPNLAMKRILAPPSGTRGMRMELGGAASGLAIEWRPGEKISWKPVAVVNGEEQALKSAIEPRVGAAVTAAQAAGDFIYAGTADGRLLVSQNKGVDWSVQATGVGSVEAIQIDAKDSRFAIAVLSGRDRAGKGAVWRTWTGGLFWDDMTGNLSAGQIGGVVVDRPSGAVYVASNGGLYFTYIDATGSDPASASKQWTKLEGNLPDAPLRDVKLDQAGNQLYVAVEGWGAYATMAPHRIRQLRAVSAADFATRPAAPGSLISIIGASVDRVGIGGLSSPVLARSSAETQIQLPFQLTGSTVSLQLDTAAGRREIGMPLEPTAPGIFVDRDGTPMLLNADSGVLLDSAQPARAGTRVQILAAGLGRVSPDWPAGVAAPANSPPKVIAPVRVFLDRVSLEVTQAVLAPGIVGFYLVEVVLPPVVNSGPAELYLETGRAESNRVRIYIEQ